MIIKEQDYFEVCISKNMIQYVKYNKILLKPGKRDNRTKAILEFFKKVQAQESKMKGFMVMDSLENQSESIVLTFGKLKKTWINFIR